MKSTGGFLLKFHSFFCLLCDSLSIVNRPTLSYFPIAVFTFQSLPLHFSEFAATSLSLSVVLYSIELVLNKLG
jgi:hypothetical protein